MFLHMNKRESPHPTCTSFLFSFLAHTKTKHLALQLSKPQKSQSRQVIAICSTFKRGVDLLFFFKAAWWREDHPPSPPILTPWKWKMSFRHPPPVPVPSYCWPSQEHLVQRPRENVNDSFLQWARHIYMKPSQSKNHLFFWYTYVKHVLWSVSHVAINIDSL